MSSGKEVLSEEHLRLMVAFLIIVRTTIHAEAPIRYYVVTSDSPVTVDTRISLM